MNKVNHKIELAANVLVAVAAVLLIGLIVHRFFLGSPGADAPPAALVKMQPESGAMINLPDFEWSAQPKTVIIALQPDCRFCTESAPFYQRLMTVSTERKNFRIVAVLPTSPEQSAAYLRTLGLSNLEIRQSPLSSLHTNGTPTLLITDERGRIINSWVGRLSPQREAEVLAQISS